SEIFRDDESAVATEYRSHRAGSHLVPAFGSASLRELTVVPARSEAPLHLLTLERCQVSSTVVLCGRPRTRCARFAVEPIRASDWPSQAWTRRPPGAQL